MIAIDFDDTYDPISIATDLSWMRFVAPLVNGADQHLLVKVGPHPDGYLPQVYNLGFGPPAGENAIVDNIRLKLLNVNKVLSTVLFHGLTFLEQNPHLTIGIDGSDDLRATMYHLMIKSNRAYLEDFFTVIGVDWYVRVYRDWTVETDDQGYLLPKPRPELFDYERQRHDLYRYYMFRLKN